MTNTIQGMEQFEGIRQHVDDQDKLWFVVVDVVETLTESPRASSYWSEMKRRDKDGELLAICEKFSILHKTNGRRYQMDCATQEGILRIIQSIPSTKVEPLRRWLAMTGSRRLDEIKADPIEAKLYDHMTGPEIAFSILGDVSTIEEIKDKDPHGFEENRESAQKGGEITGHLRRIWEEQKGKPVISDQSPLKEQRLLPPDDHDKL